jgi:hypothetical protein
MANFNPSDHTVKEATNLLVGLSDEDLAEAYDVELEGKGRRSLLDAISAARDEIREDAAEAATEAEEPGAAPEAPEAPDALPGYAGTEVVVGGVRYLVMTRADGSTISCQIQ